MSPLRARPSKFQGGDRVSYDFGEVYGLPRAKCRVRGTVTQVKGRFLNSPEFARWTYLVQLDHAFCGEVAWSFDEERLAHLP